jgi:hypothetical protein
MFITFQSTTVDLPPLIRAMNCLLTAPNWTRIASADGRSRKGKIPHGSEGDADNFKVRCLALVAIYSKFAAKAPAFPALALALAELITPVSPHKLAVLHVPSYLMNIGPHSKFYRNIRLAPTQCPSTVV